MSEDLLKEKYLSESPEEFNAIVTDFNKFSRDNKMSKKKTLEYFGLANIENTKFANVFFNCLKEGQPFLDFPKFLKAYSTLKYDDEKRLRIFFSLFDRKSQGQIEKGDFLETLLDFFQAMASVQYENPYIESIRGQINDLGENSVVLALQDLVNDIFDHYQSKEGILSFEDWRSWIEEQEFITDLLEFYNNEDFE